MKFVLLIGVFLAALLPNPELEQTLVLEGGSIIDVSNFGNALHDIRDSIIVIKDGQISAAGPRKEVRIPQAPRL
jgi:imidazolonepropionase-like amidohydrolase